MCTSTTSYASHSLIVICCIEKCVKYYLHKMLYTKYASHSHSFRDRNTAQIKAR